MKTNIRVAKKNIVAWLTGYFYNIDSLYQKTLLWKETFWNDHRSSKRCSRRRLILQITPALVFTVTLKQTLQKMAKLDLQQHTNATDTQTLVDVKRLYKIPHFNNCITKCKFCHNAIPKGGLRIGKSVLSRLNTYYCSTISNVRLHSFDSHSRRKICYVSKLHRFHILVYIKNYTWMNLSPSS